MNSLHELRARIGRTAWLACYSLEESRECHAAQRRYLRSAACCVGLAALRLIGG